MTPQVADPEAVARDVHQRLTQLREQESHLSLDALTDDAARAHLADIEHEIEKAERELRRAALADAERERREQEAKAKAESEAKAKLLTQADRLSARLPAAGQRIDDAAGSLAEAVKAHLEIAQRERVLRIEAGVMQPTSTLGQPYDSALRYWFGATGVSHALEPVVMGSPPRPMRHEEHKSSPNMQTQSKESQ
jgi:hypothetical protein